MCLIQFLPLNRPLTIGKNQSGLFSRIGLRHRSPLSSVVDQLLDENLDKPSPRLCSVYAQLSQNRRGLFRAEVSSFCEPCQILLLSVQHLAIFYNLLILNLKDVPHESRAVRCPFPCRKEEELPNTVHVNGASDDG